MVSESGVNAYAVHEDALKKVSMRSELIAVIIVFSLVPSFLLSALYVSELNELATVRVADYASRVVEQTAASAEALVQEVEIVGSRWWTPR